VGLCLARSKERRECKSTDAECRAVENLKGKRRMSFEVERWFAICTYDGFLYGQGRGWVMLRLG
jgi:hypothetical protein